MPEKEAKRQGIINRPEAEIILPCVRLEGGNMKVSEITTSVLADYMRTGADDSLIAPLFAAAKAYVMSYTGLTEAQLDAFEDLSIVILLLCSDMYDNRLLTMPGNVTNELVNSILNLHKAT
jgi:hypothetical protein